MWMGVHVQTASSHVHKRVLRRDTQLQLCARHLSDSTVAQENSQPSHCQGELIADPENCPSHADGWLRHPQLFHCWSNLASELTQQHWTLERARKRWDHFFSGGRHAKDGTTATRHLNDNHGDYGSLLYQPALAYHRQSTHLSSRHLLLYRHPIHFAQ